MQPALRLAAQHRTGLKWQASSFAVTATGLTALEATDWLVDTELLLPAEVTSLYVKIYQETLLLVKNLKAAYFSGFTPQS